MSVTTVVDLTNTLRAYHTTVVKPLQNRVETLEALHDINSNTDPIRYGIRIDQSNSDPDASVTYLYDAVGMTPAGLDNNNVFDYGDWQDFVYDICKPVMLNPDGTVKYDLDRDDQTKKADGTASEISDSSQTANAMVQFKKWYVSVTEPETDIIDIVFANAKIDNTYVAMGFEDATSGELIEKDYFYIGMFTSSYINDTYRSLYTSAATDGGDGRTQRTRIKTLGNNYDFPSFSQLFFIIYLHYLISKSRDRNRHFGLVTNPTSNYQPSLASNGGFYGNKSSAGVQKSFWIEGCLGSAPAARVIGAQAYHPYRYFYAKAYPPYTLATTSSGLDSSTLIPNFTVPVHYAYTDYVKKVKVYNNWLFEIEAGATSSTYWAAGTHNDNQAGSYPTDVYLNPPYNGNVSGLYDYNNGYNCSHYTIEPYLAYL